LLIACKKRRGLVNGKQLVEGKGGFFVLFLEEFIGEDAGSATGPVFSMLSPLGAFSDWAGPCVPDHEFPF